MTAPGTRFFIGPLTPAQQWRRKRNRDRFFHFADVADVFNVSIKEAMKMVADDRKYGVGRETRISDYLTG